MLNYRLIQLLFGALLSIALVGLLPSLMLWLDLNAFEREQLKHIITPRLPLLMVLAAVGLVVPVLFFGRFYHSHLHSLSRVNQRLKASLNSHAKPLVIDGDMPPEESALLNNTNALMAAVQQQRDSLDRELGESRDTSAREKTRLSALLNQLSQGVLVCNLEGAILLANSRARVILRSDSEDDIMAESIFALLNAELVAHALTIVRERLEHGAQAPSTTLSTVTRSGNLVRFQLAAATDTQTADNQATSTAAVQGFVITLEDIQTQHSQEYERDKLLHGLTRETRNLLSRLRTGLESLQRDSSVQRQQRTLLAALGRDTVRHSEHLERMSFQQADQLTHVWPLELILAIDLISAVDQQLQRHHDMRCPQQLKAPATSWLKADSFSLVQGLANCIAALHVEWDIDDIQLGTDTHPQHELLMIEISWRTGELRQEDFRALATTTRQRIAVGGRALIELIERHSGRAWLEEQHQSGQRICIALPLYAAPPGAPLEMPPSEADFRASADSTAAVDHSPTLKSQYATVLAVGTERNSAADLVRGESTLVALLLAGGKPQTLAQKQLRNTTLEQRDQSEDSQALDEFSRKGIFVSHHSAELLGRVSAADRQLIERAGLLDTAEIARLLLPTLQSYSLYQVATQLGLDTTLAETSDQAKLIAQVYNRQLKRLQSSGIYTIAQLEAALLRLQAPQ